MKNFKIDILYKNNSNMIYNNVWKIVSLVGYIDLYIDDKYNSRVCVYKKDIKDILIQYNSV